MIIDVNLDHRVGTDGQKVSSHPQTTAKELHIKIAIIGAGNVGRTLGTAWPPPADVTYGNFGFGLLRGRVLTIRMSTTLHRLSYCWTATRSTRRKFWATRDMAST